MTENYKVYKIKLFFNKINFISKIKKFKNFYDSYKKAPDPAAYTISERVAFLVDDEIVEIMTCQPRLASILLSNPRIINITKENNVKIGFRHIDNKFIDPFSIKETYPHE
jgi:hypothetical protein